MCNQNCGNRRTGGCARTIAWLLLGVNLGRKCCEKKRECFCVTPCPPPCKRPCETPRPEPRCGDNIDWYYARQYALYPCDRPCFRCGGGYRGEENFANDSDDGFGNDGGCGCRGLF